MLRPADEPATTTGRGNPQTGAGDRNGAPFDDVEREREVEDVIDPAVVFARFVPAVALGVGVGASLLRAVCGAGVRDPARLVAGV